MEIDKSIIIDILNKYDRNKNILIISCIIAMVVMSLIWALTIGYINYKQYDYTGYPTSDITNTNSNSN